jgi:ribose 5-phosphate isomerase B
MRSDTGWLVSAIWEISSHENVSAHQGVGDDDLNLICFGGLVVGHAVAGELLQTFLAARFTGAECFRRRLVKMTDLENKLRAQETLT